MQAMKRTELTCRDYESRTGDRRTITAMFWEDGKWMVRYTSAKNPALSKKIETKTFLWWVK